MYHVTLNTVFSVVRGTLHLGPNPSKWEPIWHCGYLGQQMSPCFANGPIVGPLNVKPIIYILGSFHLDYYSTKKLLFKIFDWFKKTMVTL
jgi:hypothetical protein